MSETTSGVTGPERPPTNPAYQPQNPKNRAEEQESFRLFKTPEPIRSPKDPDKSYLIEIFTDDNNDLQLVGPPGLLYVFKATTAIGGVFSIDGNEITIIEEALNAIIQPDDFYKKYNPELYEYGDGLFIVLIKNNPEIVFDLIDDIRVTLPFGFHASLPIKDSKEDVIILIARTDFGIDDPLRTR